MHCVVAGGQHGLAQADGERLHIDVCAKGACAFAWVSTRGFRLRAFYECRMCIRTCILYSQTINQTD